MAAEAFKAEDQAGPFKAPLKQDQFNGYSSGGFNSRLQKRFCSNINSVFWEPYKTKQMINRQSLEDAEAIKIWKSECYNLLHLRVAGDGLVLFLHH